MAKAKVVTAERPQPLAPDATLELHGDSTDICACVFEGTAAQETM